MGKKNDAFLLSDGDRLRLSSKTTLIFKTSCHPNSDDFDVAQERDMRTFAERYVVTDRMVGSGVFGKVFMAIEQTTRTQLACKVIDLRRIGPKAKKETSSITPQRLEEHYTKTELEKVVVWGDQKQREIELENKLSTYFREFEILCSLSHPNIIAVDEIYITDSSLYIFQDLATAGNLHNYISARNKNLIEIEAAALIWQILTAVCFLHKKNVVHRNLRPENIMVTGLATGARILLTNFGLARKVAPIRKSFIMTSAKQITSSEKGADAGSMFVADVCSVGVIAALLLLGSLPDQDMRVSWPDLRLSSTVFAKQIAQLTRWKYLSEQSKRFVTDLLVLKDGDCTWADEALRHTWFSEGQAHIDFENLYQRVISNWRPRVPSAPVLDFVTGRSNNTCNLKCSKQIIDDREAQLRKETRPRNVPIEPPYKPFPRKMHVQGGLWPKRMKRAHSMSEEVTNAIARDWSPASTTKSGQLHENISVEPEDFDWLTMTALQQSVASREKPEVPGLLRSDSSKMTGRILGSNMNLALRSSSRSPSEPVRIVGADKDNVFPGSRSSRDQEYAPQEEDKGTRGFSGSINPSHMKLLGRRKSTCNRSTKIRSPAEIFRQSKTLDTRDVDIMRSTTMTAEKKAPVALDVRSQTKLPTRPQSRSSSLSLEDSTPLHPLSRSTASVYDHDHDHDPSSASGIGISKRYNAESPCSSKDMLNTSQSEPSSSVWVHEEWLRLTEEDME